MIYLEISMDDSLLMHIIYSFQNLTYQVGRIFLRVWSFLHNPVEEFTTRYSVYVVQKNMSKQKRIF